MSTNLALLKELREIKQILIEIKEMKSQTKPRNEKK